MKRFFFCGAGESQLELQRFLVLPGPSSGCGGEALWSMAHSASFSQLKRSPLTSLPTPISVTEPGPSEGLILSFFHLNPIIIMPVIDNIPPFQRALKSVSTKDDIIVVRARCIQTITYSNQSGKVCPSILVPL